MTSPELSPECDNCGDAENPESGVVLEIYPDIGRICNVCRSSALHELTVLSEREARVATLKEWGYSHSEIADLLQKFNDDPVTPTKSTVDEYSRRVTRKLDEAERTVEMLDLEPDSE